MTITVIVRGTTQGTEWDAVAQGDSRNEFVFPVSRLFAIIADTKRYSVTLDVKNDYVIVQHPDEEPFFANAVLSVNDSAGTVEYCVNGIPFAVEEQYDAYTAIRVYGSAIRELLERETRVTEEPDTLLFAEAGEE